MMRLKFLVPIVFGLVLSLPERELGAQPPSPAPPATLRTLDSLLAVDARTKEATVTNGTLEAHFAFSLTNVSPAEVVVSGLFTSCGCTAAKLPEQPWRLAPGANGQISVTMNLAGKSGTVIKTVTIGSTNGTKLLFVKTVIVPTPLPARLSADERQRNQRIALADRQAVFKDDCARCHVEPSANKAGQALYAAACGICHDAAHRASMVPDLHAISGETSAEFWRNWIAQGKPGSLMPAFALSEGGMLSDAQIKSLVFYLTIAIPSRPAAQTPKPTAAAR
jgi:hypothetical protein